MSVAGRGRPRGIQHPPGVHRARDILRPQGMRWPLRTMRSRLIAGLVALLALACATVGLTSFIAVRNTLFVQLDNQLQIATNLAYKCQDQHPGYPPGTQAHGMMAGGTGSRDTGYRGTGPSGTGSTGAGSSGTGAGGAHDPDATGASLDCAGLNTGTIAVAVWKGNWTGTVVPDTQWKLSAEDRETLSAIRPSSPPGPDTNAPVYRRTLRSADGDYALTVVTDPDGDGTVYITGLPLSGVYDLLKDIAVVELLVFAGVLVIAGVVGTLWVRLSLRPLRRVAATAAAVAELPLETGEVELPSGVPDTDPVTETGQVGAAFNRMLGHVQQALARRTASETRLRRFAADASHELRTPLAAIRGYAELALRHPGEAPEPVTHALSRVLSESTRMSVLVDDLLLLARLDAGRPLNTDPVDVSRLVIDATSDAQVARPGHRWVLDLPDDPVQVRGDEHRLHQVLANLLSNAGRHTPEGTTVTVQLTTDTLAPGAFPGTDGAGDSGASVRRGVIPSLPRTAISVTDDGPGIPPELLPDLFERFTRADTARSHAADTDANSTGLGLAIVDAVVAAHGGAVITASRPGQTRFTIVLPRLVSPADDGASPVDGGSPARSARKRPLRVRRKRFEICKIPGHQGYEQ